MLLTSRFSMWMAWGADLTFFCNEAYRRDTLGKKYPWALGKPTSVVWSEIWGDIAPRIETVMRTGEATWDQSLQLFLERSGDVEETYHTFSYSPLTDDEGRIVGLLCVVSEDTEEVISRRRMGTLRDLGSRTATDLTEAETIASACRELAGNPQCLPFSLLYTLDEDGTTTTLAGSTGFAGPHPVAPATLSLADPSSPWPMAEAAAGTSVLVADIDGRYDGLPTGAWEHPPRDALVVPLSPTTQGRPLGFLVTGLNRFRPLDDPYRDFLGLVAGQLSSSITGARAYDFERTRAETLAALDHAKTDFFTNVSHEFRTPLTLLLGPAEDALSDPDEVLPPHQRDRLDVVLRNGQRLLKLVNTLLDFSRLESGRLDAHFEPVDLAVYTRELASMFDTAAERLGLELTVDCPPLSRPVTVDRDLWAKIVLNLLSNALKFTFEGGITVALREQDGQVRLAVTDSGTGIPESELPHLFERFRRVSGARSRTHEGSGIGLALVAELAELHGGTVEVDSTLGRGSSFTVTVPLRADDAAVAPTVAMGPALSESVVRHAEGFLAEAAHWLGPEDSGLSPAGADRDLPRILVVDDNADVRHYVADLLSDDYVVETAVDGEDALARAKAVPPDLVITDVMMPRLDGFGLLSALQAEPSTVGVPVVMLSARAGEEGILEGLDAGADDYLIKPFTARELLARVRANLELDRARRTRRQLERSRSLLDQAQRLARVGSWEIDLKSGAVEASGEFQRIAGRPAAEFQGLGYPGFVTSMVHPDDRARVLEALEAGSDGSPIQYEARLVRPDGDVVLVSVHGELLREDHGDVEVLRGSVQDITERRAAEEALALAAANAEAAAREHAIADELQRSLLPQQAFDLTHLDVATFYRAGVEGTQVGGDWYDVIELGAGRTALVVGDVMGRGVQAAAVMGQLRAAIRAYSRLDLPPVDVLEYLDGIVRELGENQIVTCIYAVFDPADQSVRYANAGHLPPVVVMPEGTSYSLAETDDPPLGVGSGDLVEHQVHLPSGALVVLYTDGLVERRGEDLDLGIESLVDAVREVGWQVPEMPEQLVQTMLPDGPDDDVAVLVAQVESRAPGGAVTHQFASFDAAVSDARRLVAEHLANYRLPGQVVDDAVLVTSELVTNAMLHGTAPIDLRVHADQSRVMLEVQDRANFQPRKIRPTPEDEHGRGLQIVAALCQRWGTRMTQDGKAVWCILSTAN
ncbi:MAG TPA: SpoIIE family protein phosphatase [Nocardioidaceae bacterium]|nr:SpoIIE family protein phosphatase [Nocardioidaceae bacterium]